jgi:hypothetical protein
MNKTQYLKRIGIESDGIEPTPENLKILQRPRLCVLHRMSNSATKTEFLRSEGALTVISKFSKKTEATGKASIFLRMPAARSKNLPECASFIKLQRSRILRAAASVP